MKTTLIAVTAMAVGFGVFTVWYSPRRIVARARARGVWVPAQDFEFKKGLFA